MTTTMKTAIRSFRGEYEFLSNFYVHEFQWSGDYWKTVEHGFQAAKANGIEYFKIRDATTPAAAKSLGRKVKLPLDWEVKKIGLMAQIVLAKFRVPALQDMLLATGDAVLIEENAWGDTFWGVDVKTGRGQNQLGILLMMARSSYRVARNGGPDYWTNYGA